MKGSSIFRGASVSQLTVRRNINSGTIFRRKQTVCGLSFDAAPLEVLIGGGVLTLGAAAYIASEALKAVKGQQAAPIAASPVEVVEEPVIIPRENAVFVFGATGRSGRTIVRELLSKGRTVVAGVRDASKAKEVFGELGISEGFQPSGKGILLIEAGIDITKPETLTAEIFAGVVQVVSAVGAVFGRSADGSMGYLNGMTPEVVDAQGVANIAEAAAKHVTPFRKSNTVVLPMTTDTELAVWDRLDDVIMGGQSSSTLTPAPEGGAASWAGQLIIEGGGFCGTRTKPQALDLSAYDGICLRVAANGQTFKLNLKTDGFSEPEDTYQATFDTLPDGQWTTVYLPWTDFVPVKRAKSVPNGPPLDPSTVRQFGLVLSKFWYNGYPNPNYTPGPFELKIEGGIQAYTDIKPQLLMVSSAGVERNAKIGDNTEARKKDIPIIQLNPGGVLNWKYKGEAAVRAAGLPYAVIRPVGLSEDSEGGPFRLEGSQGDRVSGKLGRPELATVVASALNMPAATGKTIELRRGDGPPGVNDISRMFLGAVVDVVRTRVGLQPFPTFVPPPPPPNDEEKKEILADPRVKAAQEAGRGGRVRSEAETDAAESVVVAVPAPADDGDNNTDKKNGETADAAEKEKVEEKEVASV